MYQNPKHTDIHMHIYLVSKCLFNIVDELFKKLLNNATNSQEESVKKKGGGFLKKNLAHFTYKKDKKMAPSKIRMWFQSASKFGEAYLT